MQEAILLNSPVVKDYHTWEIEKRFLKKFSQPGGELGKILNWLYSHKHIKMIILQKEK